MAGVFISYRRSDSDVAAGRLADDLADIFGRGAVFRDIDTLEPGEDYTVALGRALGSCAALIAVIGPTWATLTDEQGRRRLDDPDDWVRKEIEEALQREIRVIPVTLATNMPRDDEVPPALRPLLRRQAVPVTDRHWRQDVDALAEALENVPGLSRRRAVPRPLAPGRRRGLLAAVAVLVAAAVGLIAWNTLRHDTSGPDPDLSSRVRIRDSGPEGAVAGLAVASAMEGSLAEQGRPVTLSGRYIYARAQRADEFSDPNAGATLEAAVYVAERWGAPPEESWPYVAESKGLPNGMTWKRLDHDAAPFRARVYRLTGYDDIPGQLDLGRPIVAEVDVTESWDAAAKTGVITASPNLRGRSAIVIVAFDRGDRSIKFANSWGVNWGANGFGTMSVEVAKKALGAMWSVEVPPRSG